MKIIKTLLPMIVLCLALMSCSNESLNQYSDELLIAVLTDLHHVQAVSSRIPANYEKRDSILNHYKKQVAEIHDISIDDIDRILLYLESDIDRTKLLYDSVTKSLSFE